MRKSENEQFQIKQELSKFINLLQSDFISNLQIQSQNPSHNPYQLTKNLSIILSASEPQSSSLDKQNSNPSANRSFETNQKPTDLTASRNSLIETLMKTPLTSSQLVLLQKIREYIEQMRLQNQRQSRRIQQLKSQLQGQKKANDEMLNVLIKLDKQQKQLWENYNLSTEKYVSAIQKNKQIEAKFQSAKQTVISLQNDNDFMKKLIFHANQNYQTLERTCKELQIEREKSRETTDRRSIKKTSIDNLLKSAKTKKNGHSPNHSQVLRTPSPQNFQQIYQKMIIRTLKHKGRSLHHYPY